MDFISATLGRIAPRHKLLAEWCRIYDDIIASRPLGAKTLANRRTNVRHLLASFGDRRIGSIRPHEIATWLKRAHATTPVMARRLLIETRDVFDEAVSYGWIDSNPATHVRQLPARVRRRRLAMEQWQAMYAAAEQHPQRWVRPMLALALITGQRRADLARMRYCDIYPQVMADGSILDCLLVEQQKTGMRLAIPLDLRLDAVGLTLRDVIDQCRDHAPAGETLLRKSTGGPLVVASLSFRFQELFCAIHGPWTGSGTPPSLHECRSLSERMYRRQGLNTRLLLGHRRQSMTDVYNDDRGLSRGTWQIVPLVKDTKP